MTITETLTILANAATAAGAFFAGRQLFLTHKQAVTNFEDKFDQEYRKLVASLPTKALLGEELTDKEHKDSFDEFYHYFDLCNNQAFHYQKKRVTQTTWDFWLDGMNAHFARPAFKRAWREVCSRCGTDFTELREIFPCDISRMQ